MVWSPTLDARRVVGTRGGYALAVAGAPGMTNVLLVDDHRLVRSGLAGLLGTTTDITVVGEAADGGQAVDLATELSPDVIPMDLSMPVLDGVAATRIIVAADPTGRVVILTSFADHHRVTDAIAAGAVGYLRKDSDPQDVLAALRSAASVGVLLDPRVARALLPSADQRPGDGLSAREQQVLRLRQRDWRTSRSDVRSGSANGR